MQDELSTTMEPTIETTRQEELSHKSSVNKREIQEVDHHESERNRKVEPSMVCQQTDNKLGEMDKLPTVQHEEGRDQITENAHLVDIAELQSFTLLSVSPEAQPLGDESNSKGMPNDKLTNVYSVKDEEGERQEHDTELPSDKNIHILCKAHAKAEETEFHIQRVITTDKSSPAESSEFISVVEETLPYTEEPPSKEKEVDEVDVAQQSEVRKQEKQIEEIHQNRSSSECVLHNALEVFDSSGNLKGNVKIGNTHDLEVILETLEDFVEKQDVTMPDSKESQNVKKDGQTMDTTHATSGQDDFLRSTEEADQSTGKTSDEHQTGRNLPEYEESEEIPKIEPDLASEASVCREDWQISDASDHMEETVEHNIVNALAEVREIYETQAKVPHSEEDEVGEQLNTKNGAQETNASHEVTGSEFLPDLQTETILFDLSAGLEICHKENKAEFPEAAVDLTEKSAIPHTDDADDVGQNQEGLDDETQDREDHDEKAQIESKQRRRKMGSTRRVHLKHEEETQTKNEKGDLNTGAETESLWASEAELETQAEPELSVSDVRVEPEERNEAAIDTTQTVQMNPSNSSAEEALDLLFPSSLAASCGEDFGVPAAFLQPADVRDNEGKVSMPPNTENSVTADPDPQDVEKEETMQDPDGHENQALNSDKAYGALFIDTVRESGEIDKNALIDKPKLDSMSETAHSAHTEIQHTSQDSTSAHRRRKMGSTRKNPRSKGEDLHKQQGDSEVMETVNLGDEMTESVSEVTEQESNDAALSLVYEGGDLREEDQHNTAEHTMLQEEEQLLSVDEDHKSTVETLQSELNDLLLLEPQEHSVSTEEQTNMSCNAAGETTKMDSTEKFLRCEEENTEQMQEMERVWSQNVKDNSPTMDTTQVTSGQDDFLRSTEENTGKRSEEGETGRNLQENDESEEIPKMEPHLASEASVCREDCQISDIQNGSDHMEEAVKHDTIKALAEVRETYDTEAQVPHSEEGEVGEQCENPTNTEHGAQETNASHEVTGSELFPDLQTEAVLSDSSAEFEIYHKENKAEFSEAAVDLTEKSAIPHTDGTDDVGHNQEGLQDGTQDREDYDENVQRNSKQKRRKMGSTRRVYRKHEDETESKEGKGNLNTRADTGKLWSSEAELETQSEPEFGVIDLHVEPEERSEAAIDTTQTVQMNPSNSSAEEALDLLFPSSPAASCVEDFGVPAAFLQPADVRDNEGKVHQVDVGVPTSQLDLFTNTETQKYVTADPDPQNVEKEEAMQDHDDHKDPALNSDEANRAQVVDTARESGDKDKNGLDDTPKLDNMSETAHSANTEILHASQDSPSANRRRKMGSTRKNPRSKGEDLHKKQADSEMTETVNLGDEMSESVSEVKEQETNYAALSLVYEGEDLQEEQQHNTSEHTMLQEEEQLLSVDEDHKSSVETLQSGINVPLLLEPQEHSVSTEEITNLSSNTAGETTKMDSTEKFLRFEEENTEQMQEMERVWSQNVKDNSPTMDTTQVTSGQDDFLRSTEENMGKRSEEGETGRNLPENDESEEFPKMEPHLASVDSVCREDCQISDTQNVSDHKEETVEHDTIKALAEVRETYDIEAQVPHSEEGEVGEQCENPTNTEHGAQETNASHEVTGSELFPDLQTEAVLSDSSAEFEIYHKEYKAEFPEAAVDLTEKSAIPRTDDTDDVGQNEEGQQEETQDGEDHQEKAQIESRQRRRKMGSTRRVHWKHEDETETKDKKGDLNTGAETESLCSSEAELETQAEPEFGVIDLHQEAEERNEAAIDTTQTVQMNPSNSSAEEALDLLFPSSPAASCGEDFGVPAAFLQPADVGDNEGKVHQVDVGVPSSQLDLFTNTETQKYVTADPDPQNVEKEEAMQDHDDHKDPALNSDEANRAQVVDTARESGDKDKNGLDGTPKLDNMSETAHSANTEILHASQDSPSANRRRKMGSTRKNPRSKGEDLHKKQADSEMTETVNLGDEMSESVSEVKEQETNYAALSLVYEGEDLQEEQQHNTSEHTMLQEEEQLLSVDEDHKSSVETLQSGINVPLLLEPQEHSVSTEEITNLSSNTAGETTKMDSTEKFLRFEEENTGQMQEMERVWSQNVKDNSPTMDTTQVTSGQDDFLRSTEENMGKRSEEGETGRNLPENDESEEFPKMEPHLASVDSVCREDCQISDTQNVSDHKEETVEHDTIKALAEVRETYDIEAQVPHSEEGEVGEQCENPTNTEHGAQETNASHEVTGSELFPDLQTEAVLSDSSAEFEIYHKEYKAEFPEAAVDLTEKSAIPRTDDTDDVGQNEEGQQEETQDGEDHQEKAQIESRQRRRKMGSTRRVHWKHEDETETKDKKGDLNTGAETESLCSSEAELETQAEPEFGVIDLHQEAEERNEAAIDTTQTVQMNPSNSSAEEALDLLFPSSPAASCGEDFGVPAAFLQPADVGDNEGKVHQVDVGVPSSQLDLFTNTETQKYVTADPDPQNVEKEEAMQDHDDHKDPALNSDEANRAQVVDTARESGDKDKNGLDGTPKLDNMSETAHSANTEILHASQDSPSANRRRKMGSTRKNPRSKGEDLHKKQADSEMTETVNLGDEMSESVSEVKEQETNYAALSLVYEGEDLQEEQQHNTSEHTMLQEEEQLLSVDEDHKSSVETLQSGINVPLLLEPQEHSVSTEEITNLSSNTAGETTKMDSTEKFLRFEEENTGQMQEMERVWSQNVKDNSPTMDTTQVTSGQDDFLRSTEENMGKRSEEGETGRNLPENDESEEFPKMEPHLASVDSVCREDCQISDTQNVSDHKEETVEHDTIKALAEVRETYDIEAQVPHSEEGEVGEQCENPTNTEHGAQETNASHEVTGSELFPDLQTEAVLSDSSAEFEIYHKEYKAEFPEAAVDLTEKSAIPRTDDTDDVGQNEEGQQEETQDGEDHQEKAQIESRQRRRKMGSTRRVHWKHEDETETKDKKGDLNTGAETESLCSSEAELETQAEPEFGVIDLHQEAEERNEAAIDTTQTVQMNPSNSSAEEALDLLFPSSPAASCGEDFGVPAAFLQPADVGDNEGKVHQVDVGVPSSQLDLFTNTETQKYVTADPDPQNVEKEEAMQDHDDYKDPALNSDKGNRAPVIDTARESGEKNINGLDDAPKLDNMSETAHSANTEIQHASQDSTSANRRRKMGSTRKNLRSKGEDLHKKQGAGEVMETVNLGDEMSESVSEVKEQESNDAALSLVYEGGDLQEEQQHNTAEHTRRTGGQEEEQLLSVDEDHKSSVETLQSGINVPLLLEPQEHSVSTEEQTNLSCNTAGETTKMDSTEKFLSCEEENKEQMQEREAVWSQNMKDNSPTMDSTQVTSGQDDFLRSTEENTENARKTSEEPETRGKQRKRKMGSTRKVNWKHEKEMESKKGKGEDNTGNLWSYEAELETQAEPELSVSDVYVELEERNEAAIDTTQTVQMNPSNSSAEEALDLLQPSSPAASCGEGFGVPAAFLQPADVRDNDGKVLEVNVAVGTSQLDLFANTETGERMQDHVGHEDHTLISDRAPVIKIVRESEKDQNARIDNPKLDNVSETAHSANAEIQHPNQDSPSANRRRKMGSTRKNLRSKEEYLHKKQGDGEVTETVNLGDEMTGSISEVKEKEMQPEHKHKEQMEEKTHSYTDPQSTPPSLHSAAENAVTRDQRVESEPRLSPPDLHSKPALSPTNNEAPPEISPRGRRRKLGSNRKTGGHKLMAARDGGDLDGDNETREAPSEVEEGDNAASSNISISTTTEPLKPAGLLEKKEKKPVQVQKPEKTQILGFKSNPFDVVIIGNSSVGKTSFMKMADSGKFLSMVSSSIGIDSCMKTVSVDGETVVIQLWDTAGQERFHSISRQIFHKAHAFILMYDITSSQSFSAVRYWADCIQGRAAENVIVMLLGNKSDCAEREVHRREGETLAKAFNFAFNECSAATGDNVVDSLETLVRMLSQKSVTQQEGVALHKEPQQKKTSGCC
ncbi:uncharacterized protein rab44 [Genypterus blacodes]|uniref:uncharacterized protein rab44 n=1 Tax=Genypterus blacodes TaxID=154954 RepID=UPI003F762471